MYRVSPGVLVAALCLVAFRVPGLAQTSSPQTPLPTFRSTVDLLTVDTSVRDKAGQPVPDLQAADFTVTIGGKPRKVVSAVFFKPDPSAGARLSGGAAPTPHYVSNDGTQPGRVVVFALDSGTIRGGQEHGLFETASRMLDGLSSADAVGLLEMPGIAIEATRNHAAVADALRRFRGRKPSEAELMAMGRNPASMKLTERALGQAMLANLAGLVRRMAVVRAPRSVILITGGFGFDFELLPQYKELQHAAAESRVVLYTVLLEEVGYEMTRGETRPDVAENPGRTDGPATIASTTGGMFFNAAGRATGIFDRIQSEVSSFYQLAIESSQADADGKDRDVEVRVNRTGVDVRAPSHVAVPKPPKAARARDPLGSALLQPTDIPDVPLAVTTYNTHGTGAAIHVLVSAEIGAAGGAAPVEWAVQIIQNGKGIITRRGRIPAGSEPPCVISTTVEVPPGAYRLRLAAVDADDRLGVLDTPVTAGLQTAGDTILGDLIVGVAAGGQLEPRRRIERSENLTATLEVKTGTGDTAEGILQLIPGGSARSVQNTPLVLRPATSAGGPAILQARASLAAVPPGRYTASVAVQVAGRPVTRIDRMIEIK